MAARAATSILAPENSALRGGILHNQSQNVFEAVMACLVQEIGLGSGEKNPVYPAAENSARKLNLYPGENRPGLALDAVLQILHGCRACVQC